MATWKKIITSGSAAALSSVTLDTDLEVAHGGTGASTLTSGYALLGNGASAVQMINSTANDTMLVGDGSTMVAETGATLRTSIGCDVAGTDNSTDVSLAGSYDYLTLAGQAITLGQIDLTTDVTGVLPSANLDAQTAHLDTNQTYTGEITASGGLIVKEDVDGGAVFLNIANSNIDIGTDKTAEIRFGHYNTSSYHLPAGRIVAGKEGSYSFATATVDSFMAFYTTLNQTDTEYMRITSAGKVGIGTTSPSESLHLSSSGDTKLYVEGDISGSSTSTGSFAHLIVNDTIAATATTATVASTVTLADESSDTACYPVFAKDASGDVALNTDTSALTYNANTGTLSATTLGGTLSTATQNSVTTMTSLASVSDITTGTWSAGAVASTAGISGTTGTFSGNVSIAGDLSLTGGATITNVTSSNLTIGDAFAFFATGSAGSNIDSGFIVQSGSADLSGSALYHDKDDERWAVAKSVSATTLAVTPLEYVMTVYDATSGGNNQPAPPAATGSYGVGEMWIDNTSAPNEGIWIRTA